MEEWGRLMQELLEAGSAARRIAGERTQEGGILVEILQELPRLNGAFEKHLSRLARGCSQNELESMLGLLRRLTGRAETTPVARGAGQAGLTP